MKDKVFSCFKTFTETLALPKGLNSSFISLIPKKENPELVADFRPISLINRSAKLFTKVLALRLSEKIGKLVDSNQYAFIKGRQASECILVANEAIHFLKTWNSKDLILKLDFEKAFDSVKWEFLFELLQSLGFGKSGFHGSKVSLAQ